VSFVIQLSTRVNITIFSIRFCVWYAWTSPSLDTSVTGHRTVWPLHPLSPLWNYKRTKIKSRHYNIFKNRPIRNKNCLWQPCLSMDQDKMSNLYRGPSIDASYQISVHLGKRFQRRRFFRNQPVVAMFVIGSELNAHSL
jgi:hypothetical protein